MNSKYCTRFFGDPLSRTWSSIDIDHDARFYMLIVSCGRFSVAFEFDLVLSHFVFGFSIHRWGLKLNLFFLQIRLGWMG